MSARTTDAIIIGAGIIGSALARELAGRGWQVLVLDRNHAPGMGSTSSSSAVIRVHYSTLEGTALAWDGYHDWHMEAARQARGESALARFIECGCLVMETPENGFLARQKEYCRALSIPFEEWDHAAILDHLPGYDLARFAPPRRIDDPAFGTPAGGEIERATFFPTAGYVTDPQAAARNIAHEAEARGARLDFRVRVTGILRQGGRVAGVVLADGCEIHAPVVVNAAGPASSRINHMAGIADEIAVPTRPLRQEVAHTPQPEGIDLSARGPIVSDGDIGCYVRPDHGGNILIGSEMPACDPRVFVEDEEDFDHSHTDQWTNQVWRYALRAPRLPIPHRAAGVVDLYDVTPDWIPIYDTSSLAGFYLAIGTSGNQFKNAFSAARLMAGLIEYCEAGGDHDARPYRHALPHAGLTIDAGFFSRRRSPVDESSRSVLG